MPPFILVHEGAHFVTARALHIRAELHYGATTVHYPRLPPPRADLAVVAAGPVAQALVAGAGLLWLHRRRRNRRLEPATWIDWLATWAALNWGRWLAGWGLGAISATQLQDEVVLLEASGLPTWLGLVLLGLLASTFIVATVRLHRPGMRLVPFGYAFLGGFTGLNLWLHWLGPRLLP